MSRNDIDTGTNTNTNTNTNTKVDDFSDLNPKQRAMAEKLTKSRGNTINNKNSRKYMADPNVKEFNKSLRKKLLSGGGRPYAFQSLDKLESDVGEFLDLCDRTNTIPTVANLAVWLGVNQDTIYAHANNSNSPFSVFFKTLLSYFHGTLESSSIEGATNPVLYIFLGKNYFGMRDDKEIKVSAGDGSNINSQETASALQKQLEEETTPNADYKED